MDFTGCVNKQMYDAVISKFVNQINTTPCQLGKKQMLHSSDYNIIF